MKRCSWAESGPLERQYHDEQWGVPVHDDRLLFEMLILEGAQAGLSWSTILKKRAGYRAAFDDFSAAKIAGYQEAKLAELLSNPGIIRNRLKIRSAVANARCFLDVQQEYGSFDRYLWSFVSGRPVNNCWESPSEIPAQSAVSEQMSRSLKKRGFRFVGPTICYAYMQAVGMVNDHLVSCFRHAEISRFSETCRLGY